MVAEVPFVDCLTTMLDDSLPLTVGEWEEWGNPGADVEVYAVMKGYSPYDGRSRPVRYPAVLATAGLNDPRVGYWEPAKWVAKLRAADPGAGCCSGPSSRPATAARRVATRPGGTRPSSCRSPRRRGPGPAAPESLTRRRPGTSG